MPTTTPPTDQSKLLSVWFADGASKCSTPSKKVNGPALSGDGITGGVFRFSAANFIVRTA